MTVASYQSVDQQLKKLGWDWSHPRVVAYIKDLRSRHGSSYQPNNLPAKHYAKLMCLLGVYEQIDQMIRLNHGSWKAPFIVQFFIQNSTKDENGKPTNRLKLKQWVELENQVTEIYCPF